MDNAQLTKEMIDMQREISSMRSSLSSAHKRIDENDAVTKGIYTLATNVGELSQQVKGLAERMDDSLDNLDDSISRIDTGLRLQGERIGALESKPGKRWESVVGQIIGLIVAAVVGGVLTQIF